MPSRIPSALTAAECALLTAISRDQRVYEAGALLGRSTLALAGEARSVVSVDPHTGYPDIKAPSTWGPWQQNIAQAGVVSRVQGIRGDFRVYPPTRAHQLAWADLTGQRTITEDFLRCAAGVPRIAVHDYQRTGCEGATEAVDRWIARTRPRNVLRVDTVILLEYVS